MLSHTRVIECIRQSRKRLNDPICWCSYSCYEPNGYLEWKCSLFSYKICAFTQRKAFGQNVLSHPLCVRVRSALHYFSIMFHFTRSSHIWPSSQRFSLLTSRYVQWVECDVYFMNIRVGNAFNIVSQCLAIVQITDPSRRKEFTNWILFLVCGYHSFCRIVWIFVFSFLFHSK